MGLSFLIAPKPILFFTKYAPQFHIFAFLEIM